MNWGMLCPGVSTCTGDRTVAQVIREYLEESRGPTHAWYRLRLCRVFRLDKDAESAQFRSDLGNVYVIPASRPTV